MKRLLVLVVIALAGAGISYGASVMFFSPASERELSVEPEGLVDGLSDVEVEPTPSPSPTPTASPAPPAPARARVATAAATATPEGRRTLATPAVPQHFVSGPVSNDDRTEFEKECAKEKSERERDRCVDKLEAEAEAEEDERKAEEKEDRDKEREKRRDD